MGQQACCFEDGTCEQLDPAECEALTGTFQGPFTSCAGDDPNGIDDVCETDVGACCLSDGSCVNVPLAECQQDGGDFAGVGAGCRGDVDQNGIDDMCEITEAVPALTGPGLLLMAGLLVVAGVVILRRWRAQTV